MTKTEALNKSAQEAGFPKFDKTLFKHFEKNEVELENIIRRAMELYVNEHQNELPDLINKRITDLKVIQASNNSNELSYSYEVSIACESGISHLNYVLDELKK